MLEKYKNFLNSDSIENFGDIPLKLKGTYKFSKYNNNKIYFKISINLGCFLISKEIIKEEKIIEKELLNFINEYFTNIEKYELEDLFILAKNLINDKKTELDIYDYLEENIIAEFENTIDYDILKEKYSDEIKQICNIYKRIYKYILHEIECN